MFYTIADKNGFGIYCDKYKFTKSLNYTINPIVHTYEQYGEAKEHAEKEYLEIVPEMKEVIAQREKGYMFNCFYRTDKMKD